MSDADRTIPAVPPGAALEPQTLGSRYRLIGLLGSGAMGRVYKARDLALDEVVALKLLRTELSEAPGMLDRFRREARLARHVTHRNVVRTFDIGEHEGAWFLTMELVEGESLAAALERELLLPVGRAVDLAIEVCHGLAAAHQAGVVHRDLKPGNVMLARDGRVLISDFGIAFAAEDAGEHALTADGLVLGTPTYMAPEQVEAGASVDHRADLYALGAMLYEMLTGEPVWKGSSVFGIAAARLVSPPPDPCQTNSALPAAIGPIVLRCLARDPRERFQSAEDLAAALATLPRADANAAAERPGPALVGPRPLPFPFGAARPGIKTLAVLPFRNAGAPAEDYIAEGLTEEIVDTLSMTPGLRVRATSVVRRRKDSEVDNVRLGEALGVQVIVDGTVRRAGASVRISVRLVGVSDGFQLWAQRFDRGAEDLLVVADEIARAVAEALQTEVPPALRRAPPDVEAIDLYLRARQQYRQRWLIGAVPRAVELFEAALARAPEDPTILAGHAMALVRLGWQVAPDPTLRARAAAICERAVALAPNLAETRLARGSLAFNFGDLPQAVRELLAAIAKNPGLAEAHELLGTLLCEVGATEEGIRYLEAAWALDPEAETTCVWLCRVHSLLGDRAAADAWAARVQSPAFQPILAVVLGRAALSDRDPRPVRAVLARLPAEPGVGTFARALADAIEHGAISAEASAFLQSMIVPANEPRRRSLGHQLNAEVALVTGHPTEALEHLEHAADAGLADVVWLDRCTLLEPLRSLPRFRAVRTRAGAAAREILESFRAR